MVYLNPPYHIIDGVSIFTDHEDPLQFYYLPLMPHLTTIDDPVAGQAIPQLSLIKYRGEAGNGGFLNFDVNLGVDQDQLDEIRRKIREQFKLKEEPRIGPVPLVDGSVKLMILGNASDDTEEEEEENQQGPQFVIKMDHAAKPALYGANQASFSVELDEAGVVVLEKALEGELAPIGVVYSLEYLALRKAYSVSVTADWERVQKHLHESFGTNFFFFSSQIDKVVDELIEDRIIEIQIDSFIPPGEDASDIKGRLDQAVNEVKDMVLENFFEPSLDPIQEKEDGWDKALHVAERLAFLGATKGISGIGGFKYKNIDYTRIDKKSMNVNMTERTTVKRKIFPQAHLSGLFRILRDSNGEVEMDRFITAVDLDNPWFEERTIKAISRVDFQKDQVESLNVRLVYDGHPKNVILDPKNPEATLNWNSVLENGKVKRPVKASYEVSFKNVDSAERPTSLHSKEEIIDVQNFEVRPRELYTLVPINILALDFPWEQYPHVEVQVKYQDEQNHISIDENFLLNAEKTGATWDLFTMNPNLSTFNYKLIYRSADHRDIEMPWATNDSEQIIIRDPFPAKRRLKIVPAFNWREIDIVFVDITYEDPANNIYESMPFEFTIDDRSPKTFEVQQLANPEHRFLTYRATAIYKDGRIWESLPFTTLMDRAVISSRMKGHRIITVSPDNIPFTKHEIEEVEVLMKYEDQEARLSYMDSFFFRSKEDPDRYFEYDFANPDKTSFEYQLLFNHSNGLQSMSGWKRSMEETLLIQAI